MLERIYHGQEGHKESGQEEICCEEGAGDREQRMVLETMQLSDVLEKNLLILRTIMAVREGIRQFNRIEDLMTTV